PPGVDGAAVERTVHRLLRVPRRAAAGGVGDLPPRRCGPDSGGRDARCRLMARPRTVSDSIEIAVDPQTAYAAVSDITQMGRWSPENTGGTVDDPGAGGGVDVGASF